MRVLFFDGYCSLCNGLIDWMMRWDQSEKLQFASLQGTTAANSLPPEKIHDLDTIVYLRDGKVLTRSSAVLAAIFDMGGVFQIAGVLKYIPPPIRDLLYNLVAKNRFLFFGRRETCRVPTSEEKQRLLP